MFRRTFLKGLDANFPSKLPENVTCTRAWDKAYREPSDKYKYPDYTASIKLYKDNKGEYYIAGDFDTELHDPFKKGQDIVYGRFRKGVGVRDEWMLQQATLDGKDCIVTIPSEHGAGVAEWEQMRSMFMDEGFKVVGAKTGNKKGGKGLRFAAFASAAEQGAVHILVDTFPNKATLNAFLQELEKFDPDGRSTATIKDDWVDAISDAFLTLQQKKVSKRYVIPSNSGNTALSRHRQLVN